jgi:hypothetical protein
MRENIDPDPIPFGRGKSLLKAVKKKRTELKKEGFKITKWFFNEKTDQLEFKVKPIQHARK